MRITATLLLAVLAIACMGFAQRLAGSRTEAMLIAAGLSLCLAALALAVRSHGEVARLAEALQKNADRRRSLFADISHELRTPLAVLKGELEAMDDGVRPLAPPAIKALLGEVDGLTRLVADLHELALAGSGGVGYRMQPLLLDGVLRETLALFVHRFEQRGLRLAADIAPDLRVQADEARLRQVLHNLLENSLRYTQRGGEVRVSAGIDAQGVAVRIEDSAPGVAEHELPFLFDRFYRAATPGVRAGEGSGLGLAICRVVAEAHGGRIEARSSSLGGLAVTLRLPELAP